MRIDPPTAGIVAEVVDDDARRLERAVAVAECGPDAAVAEADDVVVPARGEPGETSRMLVDAPPECGSNVDDTPASERTRNIELSGFGLRPSQLGEILAAVVGRPDIGIGADVDRLAVG